MLVTAYIVERGLILEPYEVESKTNEITALPAFIQQMALKGGAIAFDAISTQKNYSGKVSWKVVSACKQKILR